MSFYFDYGQPDQFQIGGAVNVVSGSATSDPTTALPAGSDTITAVYSGGVGFAGSQGTDAIQVNSAATTTTLIDNGPNPSAFGGAVSFSGTVSPSVPDGDTVTLEDSSTSGGPYTVLDTTTTAGSAFSFSESGLPVGTSYLVAVYGGDGDFQGSTSNEVAQVVNQPTTTSLTSNPVGPITQGDAVDFTATTNPNPGNVGTVSFYFDYGQPDQIVISSNVPVVGGMATSAATTALPGGSDLITAIYSGGTGFAGSTGTLTIQVTSAAPPNISNVVINQDISALYNAAGQPFAGAQRSMVNDVVYTFSEPVSILAPSVDPNVFTIAVASAWTGTVPTLNWAPVAGSGNTEWAVTFSGNGVTGGSIANGAYTITVNDLSAITAVSDSQQLTVTPGAAPSPGNPGYATQQFYRLYGDINGDEFVNASDNFQFKPALTTYNAAFDSNDDGFVNALDNMYFKQDLTVNFSGFTPTI